METANNYDGASKRVHPCVFTRTRFTGKERDTESGNDYFGARYYASSMGRFLSPDWSAKVAPVPYAKLENPQTLNLYAYVGNNPLVRVDADGHCWPQWLCNLNKKFDQAILAASMFIAMPIIKHDIKVTEEHRQYLSNNGVLIVDAKGHFVDAAHATAEQVNNAFNVLSMGAQIGGLKGFGSDPQLQDHFTRHGGDFGAKSASEYEQQAESFLGGTKGDGVLEKVRQNGDVVRYNPATEEFGVAKADGTVKTYYKPDPAVHGYTTNMDYFNAQ